MHCINVYVLDLYLGKKIFTAELIDKLIRY